MSLGDRGLVNRLTAGQESAYSQAVEQHYGRPVRTQWTLVDDPRSRVSREQLTKTDASGRAVLVVAVVTPSDDGNQPKGDQL